MPLRGPRLFRSYITSVACALLLVAAPNAAFARAHATPTPAATPTPQPEDPAATKIARQQFVAWQAGVLDKEKYTDTLYAKISADQLKTVSTNLGRLGALTGTEFVKSFDVADAPAKGYRALIYHFTTAGGAVYEQLVLTPDNKVAGIVFSDKMPNPQDQ